MLLFATITTNRIRPNGDIRSADIHSPRLYIRIFDAASRWNPEGSSSELAEPPWCWLHAAPEGPPPQEARATLPAALRWDEVSEGSAGTVSSSPSPSSESSSSSPSRLLRLWLKSEIQFPLHFVNQWKNSDSPPVKPERQILDVQSPAIARVSFVRRWYPGKDIGLLFHFSWSANLAYSSSSHRRWFLLLLAAWPAWRTQPMHSLLCGAGEVGIYDAAFIKYVGCLFQPEHRCKNLQQSIRDWHRPVF